MPRDSRLPDLIEDQLQISQVLECVVDNQGLNISIDHQLKFLDWAYDWWDFGGNWCTPRLGLRPLHTKGLSNSTNGIDEILAVYAIEDITSIQNSGYNIKTLLPSWCDANTILMQQYPYGNLITPLANTYLDGVYELTGIALPALNDKYLIRYNNNTVAVGAQIVLSLLFTPNYELPQTWIIGPITYSTTSTATWTTLTTDLTLSEDNDDIRVGQTVSGVGIPDNTTVVSVAGTDLVISNTPTLTGADVALTFTGISNSDWTTLLDGLTSDHGIALMGNYTLMGGPIATCPITIELTGIFAGQRNTTLTNSNNLLQLVIQKITLGSAAVTAGGSVHTGLYGTNIITGATNQEYLALQEPLFKSLWDHLDIRVYTNYIEWCRQLCNYHGLPFPYTFDYVDGNLSLVPESFDNQYASSDDYNASGWPIHIYKLFEQLWTMLEGISASFHYPNYSFNPIFAKGITFAGFMDQYWANTGLGTMFVTNVIYTDRWKWTDNSESLLGYKGKYTKDDFQSLLPNSIAPNIVSPSLITYPAMTLLRSETWYEIIPCVANCTYTTTISLNGINLSTTPYYSINGDYTATANHNWLPVSDFDASDVLINRIVAVYGRYDTLGSLTGNYDFTTNTITLNFTCVNLPVAQIALSFSADGINISGFPVNGLTTVTPPNDNTAYWAPKYPQSVDPTMQICWTKIEFVLTTNNTTAGINPVNGNPIPAGTFTSYSINVVKSPYLPITATGAQLTELLNDFITNSPDTTATGFSVSTGITTTTTTHVVSDVVDMGAVVTDEQVAPNNPNGQVWWIDNPLPYTEYTAAGINEWNGFSGDTTVTNSFALTGNNPLSPQILFQQTRPDFIISGNANTAISNAESDDPTNIGRYNSQISAYFGNIVGPPLPSISSLNNSGFSITNQVPLAWYTYYTGNNIQNGTMTTAYHNSLAFCIDTRGLPVKGYLGAVFKDSIITGLTAVWGDLTGFSNANFPVPDTFYLVPYNIFWSLLYIPYLQGYLKSQPFAGNIIISYGSIAGRLRDNDTTAKVPITTVDGVTTVNYGPRPISNGLFSTPGIYNTFELNTTNDVDTAYTQMYKDMVDNAQLLYSIPITTDVLNNSSDITKVAMADITVPTSTLNSYVPPTDNNIIYIIIDWDIATSPFEGELGDKGTYAIPSTDSVMSDSGITKAVNTTTVDIISGYSTGYLVNKDDTDGNRVNSTLKLGTSLSLSLNAPIFKCDGQ